MYMSIVSRRLRITAWTLSSLSVIVSFVAWAGRMRWEFDNLSSYSLFPLFGLLALSLMWSHYIMAALRKYYGANKTVLKQYFDISSLAVLAAILMHPGILIWQLWRDGFGLPPDSYLDYYVAPGLGWVAMLGTISFIIFIAYELRHVYGDRSWWKYVQYASDAGMFLVFYHSLRLGSTLNSSWLQGVWYLYIVSFVSALVYIYAPKHKLPDYMSHKKETV